MKRRASFALAAIVTGIVAAGFWNPRLIDGFGRDVIAAGTIGDTGALANSFAQHGPGFGFIFGAVAGLAATFTACNCVVFAMLPSLAASESASSRRGPLRLLGTFTVAVLAVGAVYGLYVGFEGPAGVEAMNGRGVRRVQAMRVFTSLGIAMLIWGAARLGFLDPLARYIPVRVRAGLNNQVVQAGLLGLMVGAFMIGRPYPAMRHFLTYAASAGNPLYAAGVMMIQGLGQIALMIVVFIVLTYPFGARLVRWRERRPQQVQLVGAMAMLAGGAFFVFYWGLAFQYGIGRWGFRLGWY